MSQAHMSELIERLRAEAIQPYPYVHRNPDGPEGADEITRLQALVAELAGALEPFAKEAGRWEPRGGAYWPDDVPFPAQSLSTIKIGDLRRARTTLSTAMGADHAE